MKKSELKQIIREEIKKSLNEGASTLGVKTLKQLHTDLGKNSRRRTKEDGMAPGGELRGRVKQTISDFASEFRRLSKQKTPDFFEADERVETFKNIVELNPSVHKLTGDIDARGDLRKALDMMDQGAEGIITLGTAWRVLLTRNIGQVFESAAKILDGMAKKL
jgi:hypothetical protein